MPKKLTHEEFTKRLHKLYGDKYICDDRYNGNNIKVKMICSVHGEFYATPMHLMKGHSCPTCAGKNKTTSLFKKELKEKHGDVYECLDEYINATTFIKFRCNTHNTIFKTSPNRILCGHSSCKPCSHQKRNKDKYKDIITTHDFIDYSVKKYGDLFTYENCEYISKNVNVKINCKYHGEFSVKPKSHLHKNYCPVCIKEKSKEKIIDETKTNKNKELFIEKSKRIHNNFYTYGNIDYKNSFHYISITCPVHGEFLQRPRNHLLGKRCKKCANNQPTQTTFIEMANEKHKKLYDYSLSVFENRKTPIKIICKTHGIFLQRPDMHLTGQGCPRCCKSYKQTTETFIEKAKEIHGDLYDYSKVEYVNSSTPITIICKKHGEFTQKPSNHLDKCGCQICKKSSGEREVAKILKELDVMYKEQIWFDDFRKIHPYRFDFGIYHNDVLKGIIEFNGEQHYRVVYYRFANREECEIKHKDTVERDVLKREYCKNNNIPLLDIKYTDKKIKNIIIKFLQSIGVLHIT